MSEKTVPSPTPVVMSLSGGMDSTGLLLHYLARGSAVEAISFYYGQKHSVELHRAAQLVQYLRDHDITTLGNHHVVDISGAMQIFSEASALTAGGIAMPEGFYEKENMVQTVVPNRNAIFSSFVYAKALAIASTHKMRVDVGLGVHSGDHAIYPDCRMPFFDALGKAFALGNWDSELVNFDLPFVDGDKESILRESAKNCATLGVDFDEVFAMTNTSYNPTEDGKSSGKSGADVERVLAFHAIGRKDPVEYVDGWEATLEFALKAQSDFEAGV